jgi:hypothetical protein
MNEIRHSHMGTLKAQKIMGIKKVKNALKYKRLKLWNKTQKNG